MSALGMTNAETIVAATQTASEMLGLQDDIGAVAQGRRAEFIALEGNPLEDISAFERVRFVMKDGCIVKGISRVTVEQPEPPILLPPRVV